MGALFLLLGALGGQLPALPESGSEMESRAEPDPVSIVARTRTLLFMTGRPYYDVSAGRLVDQRYAPGIQDVYVAAEVSPELQIVVDGWTALDMGTRVLSKRVLADLVQGWVRWRRPTFSLSAGRLFVYAPALAMRLDGGKLRLEPKTGLLDAHWNLELWGGVPVQPRFGDEPLLSDRPGPIDTPLMVARGAADWDRPGDWTIGAMAGAEWSLATAKLGYVRVQNLAIVDQEALVASLFLGPIEHVSLVSSASFDLFARALEELHFDVTARVARPLELRLYGRAVDPALLLPSSSILSVFESDAYRGLGLGADWWLSPRLRLSADGELRVSTGDTDGNGPGYRAGLALRRSVAELPQLRALLAFDALDSGWNGAYQSGRLGLDLAVSEPVRVALDSAVFRLSGGARDEGDRVAARTALSAFVQLGEVRVGVTGRATVFSELSRELAVIGKLEWDAGQIF